jgi:hypothetical protein
MAAAGFWLQALAALSGRGSFKLGGSDRPGTSEPQIRTRRTDRGCWHTRLTCADGPLTFSMLDSRVSVGGR